MRSQNLAWHSDSIQEGAKHSRDDILSTITVYISYITPMLCHYGCSMGIRAYEIALHVVTNIADFAIILWY
jgi:hypothetical protein